MLTLLTAQPDLKEVRVPDYLYWYMGAVVLACLIVFFLLPVFLSKSKPRPVPRQDAPPQDTADADRD